MYISIKRDGLNLHGRLDTPECAKFPLAILFHGFGGSIDDFESSVFSRIAQALVKCGIGVMRFDFNGHGKSDGDFSCMNIFNEINDAIAILEYAQAQSYTKDIYLIGHSQGGVVAGMLAGLYPDLIKRLVLLAPASSLKADARAGRCFNSSYDTNSIPDKINVDGTHIVGGHYFRIAKNLPIYETTKNFKNPTLIIQGLFDELIPRDAATGYLHELENCRVEFMPGLNHGLYGDDTSKMIDMISSFLTDFPSEPLTKEVLVINVTIIDAVEIKGDTSTVRSITFNASCNCDIFRGETVSVGTDTQTVTSEGTTLSARYILKGVDRQNRECSLFIENNGQIMPNGTIYTTPKITTDSLLLKFLENTPLTGTVIPEDNGVKVVISQKLYCI